MAFLSKHEISNLGFKSVGDHVLISDKASFYSPESMTIGSHVRIDDFCVLSGQIHLGSYIHISAYAALYGKYGIEIQDFSGLSPRSTIFSASDDFSGKYMISPMVPEELTNVLGGKVTLEKYTQVGAGSIIMPDITLAEGTVVGAMSFLKESTGPWEIYHGCPAKFFKKRDRDIIALSRSIPS